MRNRIIHSRQRGIALLWLIIMMSALVGFCSLAVDLGRVQVATTELRRAADAAARAGAASLMQGTSTAQSAAVAMAAENSADGTTVTLSTSTDVQFGWWNYTTHTFTVNANPMSAPAGSYPAIRVYARRTTATKNAVQLLFAGIIGCSTCDVTTVSVAALVTSSASSTNYVTANGDPWLAGAGSGTLASTPDPGYPGTDHNWEYDIAGTYQGTDSKKVEKTDLAKDEPYATPFEYDVTPGTILTISVPMDSSDMASNSAGDAPSYYANGSQSGSFYIYNDDAASYATGTDTDGYSQPSGYTATPPGYTGIGNASSASDAEGSEHGISNVAAPLNSVVGVFLDGNVPDTEDSSVPPGLDYSTQTQRDYLTVSPQARQSFYIGNGQTSGSIQQTIVVPANVTRMYLGTMDGHEWSNNSGGYNATITAYTIEIVQ